DFDAAIVHPLKFRAASDPFGWSKLQLLAADREPLATLGAAAFQHQAAVLRAHSDQKTMRPLAVARIGLERPNSLGHDIPSIGNEPSMLAKGSEKCQSNRRCVTVGVLLGEAPDRRSNSMQLWSVARVFHTCGKTCGKSPK